MNAAPAPMPEAPGVVVTLGGQACHVTPELAQVFYKSAALCADRSVDVSYTSVLLVLSVSSFDFSPVLNRYLKFGLTSLLDQGKFRESDVTALMEQEPVNRDLSLGVNFNDVWECAQRFVYSLRDRTGAKVGQQFAERAYQAARSEDLVFDVRHLVGAYLAEGDSVVRLQQVGINVEAAQRDFVSSLRELGPEHAREALQWRERFTLAFSTIADVDPNSVEESGSSSSNPLGDFVKFAGELAEKTEEKAISLTTYFLTDQWTTKDLLEYDRSAYAIYCFLMHPLTSSPFALSVLAPWGGGKSSFMRMLRAYLDPDEVVAAKAAEVSATVEHAALKVGDVMKVLGDPVGWIKGETARLTQADFTKRNVVSRGGKERGTRITVWLNAWKYQNTEQIWAGLADAIITEVAARLKPEKREIFWLKLNLKRVDVAMLRTRVHQQILQAAYQKTRKWLATMLVPFALSLVYFLFLRTSEVIGAWAWTIVIKHLVGYAVAAVPVHLMATKVVKAEEKEKPAFIDFKELMQIPDYATKAGFIHQTTTDLKYVFDLLDDQPLVIFIDDLDRCSPAKIAEVFEGVNLFLSGEFPKCIFVLGMDDEMVAAGLDVLYEKQAAKLLHTGESTSIGWRYLDKFVQMPLVLPSPSGSIRTGYVSKLLSLGVDKRVPEHLKPLPPLPPIPAKVKFAGYSLPEETLKQMDDDAAKRLANPDPAFVAAMFPGWVDPNAWYAEVDLRVREFDEDTGLIQEILEMLPDFLSNPRDLKRWLNVFRYHYFVQAGPKRQIDLKLLAVKVGLELQWPDALRCIERLRAADRSGLDAFVESAARTEDIKEWREVLETDWGVVGSYAWTGDLRLYLFLKEPFRVRQGVSFVG